MNNLKILCITPIKHIPNAEDLLKELGDLTIIEDPTPKDLELIPKDFDVIFTNPNKSKIFIGPDIFSNWNNLRFVCTASTGTVHIDKGFLNERNIELISLTNEYEVLNTISSTAELAFTLMMASLRKLIPACDSVKSSQWDYEPYVGRQINKLKICVFGYGRLGSMFAHYCKSFGADVYVYDPYKEIPIDFKEIKVLEKDLKNIDVISIHMHVNKETQDFFNKKILSYLKSDILIVNTSRGELINEYDLVQFLNGISLYGDPELDFGNESYVTIRDGKNHRTKYFFADPSVIVTPPEKTLTLPTEDVCFTLDTNSLTQLLKAAAVYQLPDLSAIGEAGVVKLVVRDKKNDTSNEFAIVVGETDREFIFNFKVENIKIIPGAYNVVISSKLLAQFSNINHNLRYFIALEPDSTFTEK